jgi:hypothetical protein
MQLDSMKLQENTESENNCIKLSGVTECLKKVQEPTLAAEA